ncbi:SAM-dependent methyltransferase [Candidatus Rhodobacter oscarellae]|uniref:SAM-dependent methyltransferase n=1 Tax=Candidatus Rhodobacter oscarellae TaxID=1675527 RepID=A0A0J9E4I5_9RHOB|nr:glycosyltransferase family 2 protein [Candidatus Rhodobacter lobularis]KMW57632.1 SAM-dependent methyltransferase [Candidatus Rhodobacter lobularis]
MSTPGISYETYAARPTADGPQDLRVKIFRPEGAEGPLPLLIWFHSGGFRTGDIEARGHDRVARLMMRHGYACAYVQYRLRARAEDLSDTARALLPDLVEDARARSPDLNPDFTGAAALAATEDGAAFLAWLEANRAAQGFSGHYVLGGSSAGAMTVLNLLTLAPLLKVELPKIASALVMSGAFAYPSYFRPPPTRVLAIHGTHEPQIGPLSIRGYAYMAGEACSLIEHAEHQHGDPRVTRAEPLRHGVRRWVNFDRGQSIASERQDRERAVVQRAHKICVFTCVRNEGPFLLEWIAHNRAIGVTDFVIFSNDCDDGTAELLDALDARGIVKHVQNPSVALGSDQHLNVAIHCAQYTKAFSSADYAILTDVDEFIQINVADGTLNSLLAVTGYPDVISLSELLFGFGGVERFEDRLITSQFRVSDPLRLPKGAARRGVTSIMRIWPGVESYSDHRPQLKPGAQGDIDWVDGAGAQVPGGFIEKGRRGMVANGRYALARVNHYTRRSGESMLVQCQRDEAVRPDQMREKYFRDRSGEGMQNDSFQPFVPPLKRELAALLSDPEIQGLHQDCVARHSAKIAALKADPERAEIWRAIQEELSDATKAAPQAAE